MGPWVTELEKCWRSLEVEGGPKKVHIDVTDITSIDTNGKAVLGFMHRQGAELIGRSYQAKCLIEEFLHVDSLDRPNHKKEGSEVS